METKIKSIITTSTEAEEASMNEKKINHNIGKARLIEKRQINHNKWAEKPRKEENQSSDWTEKDKSLIINEQLKKQEEGIIKGNDNNNKLSWKSQTVWKKTNQP